jgi:hypothetical protein
MMALTAHDVHLSGQDRRWQWASQTCPARSEEGAYLLQILANRHASKHVDEARKLDAARAEAEADAWIERHWLLVGTAKVIAIVAFWVVVIFGLLILMRIVGGY